MSEIGLTKKSNNIFFKIRTFLVKLLNEKKNKKQQGINHGYNINNRQDFKKRLEFIEDKEEIRLLKLQQELENGKIQEENIADEDFEKLHDLYDKQIEEINNMIEFYRKKIMKVKSNLN